MTEKKKEKKVQILNYIVYGKRKKTKDILASAPLMVSLLTIRAWMLGSQLVGPYTSMMGVMSRIMDGLKNFKKLFTCSVRKSMFSRTCLLAFFWRTVSSVFLNFLR